ESCMQMEAHGRPSPADLQSQLAPHLFGSGSDDSGTASAWLPERAVSLIESRRGGRPAIRPAVTGSRPAPAARVPAPAHPVPPPPSHDPVVPGRPGTAPALPAPAGAPDTGPVR
ncbi:serine/threonine protein kinase, partial [Streptomyces sp. TRM76130]|nr:serine/threonine protein kinase [Streptomyces sp. TRM76130]